MRTFQQQRNYERLEQLPLQVPELVRLGLRQIWQVLADVWQLPSREPRVRQKSDRLGNIYWEVYDPFQDCILRFDEEQSVMVWLEEQHHRQFRHLWSLS